MSFPLILSVLFLLGLFYWFPVRRWYRHWGATITEIVRVMPGDSEVPNPTDETTIGVTIDARPMEIWPWLVQLGYRRGGLYSYDWLDRSFGYLDAPSSDRILPQFQQLSAGEVIPVGRGDGFPVKRVEPGRALVLGGDANGFQWVWELALYPIDDRRTRFVSRNRVRLPRTIGSRVFMCVLEPAAFIMTRKMLLGIKRRAESLAMCRNIHQPNSVRPNAAA